jgi:RNA polymerase sigma-70 factor (ECF subfamily)
MIAMDAVSEERLPYWLHRCASGDVAAFEQLYKATSPQLFAIAVRLVRDRRLAEDVLQDAFVQVWHRAGDYHAARGTVFAWMSTLVRYRAIDLLRKRNRPGSQGNYSTVDIDGPELELLLQEATASQPDEPLTETLGADQSRWLSVCLERLSDLQRRCLALAYFQGLTHFQLAERLAQPLGTIKSRIRRALGRLKDCLTELDAHNEA